MSNYKSDSTSDRVGVISVLIAVPFVSLTGLFGKFLHISPLLIVQWRTIFAFATLSIAFLVLRKKFFFNDLNEFYWLIISGSILGAHWIAFFKSIQESTVAIGLLSFASYPLFTTIMEPLFLKESYKRKNFLSTLLVLFGIALIASSKIDDNEIISGSVFQGILWGLAAGLGFAVLTLINRVNVRNKSPLVLTCWQNGFAAMVLIPWSFSESSIISLKDWGLLLLLGVVCTVGGHSLLINGLRYLRAQLASLVIAGLEPVVGIFFAYLLLGEIPSIRTVLGGILILFTTIFMTKRSI